MNIDQLKEVWKKAEQQDVSESNQDLNLKLQAVTSTQGKIRKYFRFEMITAVIVVILFGTVVYISGDLEPYFYKLFALVVLGSLPLNIRLFLSMKHILGIKYTSQLKENIISARNHLKTTIRIYYALVVFTLVALVLMSYWDDYFLQLSLVCQLGVISYFILFFIIFIYLIKKFYGGKLRELEELLKDT